MGVIQLALGAESERGDIFDFEAGTSDSDIEEEERRHEFVAMPRALQRVEAAPGFLKRTYGVLEYDSTFMERRRRKCAKLGQQLDGLRAVVPYSTRRREINDSIVVDAYYYIAKLQKQVEDLSSELLEDASNLVQTHDEELEARTSLPMVEVMKRDGVLEVHIVCANRPGLLVDVMAAVESRGLTIAHAKIACHSDIVFEYLSLENEESVTQEVDEAAEIDSVKALIVNAICGSADLQ